MPAAISPSRRPKYSPPAALDNHAARLTSRYIAQGYYDAKVTVTQEVQEKEAKVHFDVVRGDFHKPLDMKTICGCLFKQRRDAEKQGIVDFSATMDESGVPKVLLGKPYTVGRINFSGYKHYSDSTIRRNMVLDEGAPLDSMQLRKSLDRLNRSGMFEAIDERQVQIKDTLRPGVADINIRLIERKHGAWNFSGPVPLSASISMRLPAWGQARARPLHLRRLLQHAGLLLHSEAHRGERFVPILSLERPFMPGSGWLSGFALSPQIPPQADDRELPVHPTRPARTTAPGRNARTGYHRSASSAPRAKQP